MPRINDKLLDCAVYLYPSEKAAKAGERAGGSGFLVGVQSTRVDDFFFTYIVTNSHIIRESRAGFVRLNTTINQMAILPSDLKHWIHHPDGDDLAAITVGLKPGLFKFNFIPDSIFINDQIIKDFDIGVGDEVVMVGRFINHEGKQKNLPAARFGNVSMMPIEPITQPRRGIAQESFLVEMRSISGFSGSPVLVTIDPSIPRPKSKTMQGTIRIGSEFPIWLLGVDWGHIRDSYSVIDRDGNLHPEKLKVKTNTNMAAVVPAWKLRELLDEDVFASSRKLQEDQIIEHGKNEESGVVLDLIKNNDNTLTQEDFTDS